MANHIWWRACCGGYRDLDNKVTFPLLVGEDYGLRSYPTLMVARSHPTELFDLC
jgi:hypothetical protein